MFENVHFFALVFKIAKSAIMTQANFSWKIPTWVSINEEFDADFKFVNADFKKCPFKKLKPKTMRIVRSFLLITFTFPGHFSDDDICIAFYESFQGGGLKHSCRKYSFIGIF
jgi:hypothetical protein